MLISHEHTLHVVAVRQPVKIFASTVKLTLLYSVYPNTVKGIFFLKPYSQFLAYIGHLAVITNKLHMEPVIYLINPEGFESPLLKSNIQFFFVK